MIGGIFLALAGWVFLSSCGGGGKGPCSGVKTDPALPDAELVFNPTGSDFFDFPFPSDLRLTQEGTIDLSGFPTGQTGSIGRMILDSYVARAREITFGFGMNAPVYFHLSQPILSCSLPARTAAPSAADSVFVVTLSGTPEFVPLEIRWTEDAGEDPFWTDNLLTLLPKAGHPLSGGKTYLAVLTNRIKGKNGRPLVRPEMFKRIWEEPVAIPEIYPYTGWVVILWRIEEVKSRLAELGVPEEEVVGWTVFTTQNAVHQYELARAAVDQALDNSYLDITNWREVNKVIYYNGATPSGKDSTILRVEYAGGGTSETYLEYTPDHPGKTVVIDSSYPYRVFEGWINTASLQGPAGKPFSATGTLPLSNLDLTTGRINYEKVEGKLRLVSQPEPEPMRITVLVPHDGQGNLLADCPVLLWDHGTGGSAYNCVQRLNAEDDGPRVAEIIASHGVAIISRDQPLFGQRYEVVDRGMNPWITYYNFLNIGAFRDNLRQSGIDAYVLLRLLQTRLNGFLKQQGLTQSDQTFKTEALYKFGHSLGGFTSHFGLALSAGTGDYRKALLSGAGGLMGLFFSDSKILSELMNDPQIAAILPVLGLGNYEGTITFPILFGAAAGIPAASLSGVDRFHPIVGLFQTLVEPGDPINFTGDIHIPVTYLMGIGDWQVPNSSTRAMAEAVSGSQLVECHPTGDYDPHYCTFREEEAFSIIDAFFSAP